MLIAADGADAIHEGVGAEAVLLAVVSDGAAVSQAVMPVILAVGGPGIGPLMRMLLHQGLVLGAVHAPQLGAVEGIGGAHIHAVLGGADSAQAVVGAVAEAIPGDGVEVHAVLGHQQVKAVLALLGIVVAAEVVHKVVDRVVIHSLVQGLEDGLHGALQVILQALGVGAAHSHAGDLGVFLGKACAVQLHAQQVEHLLLEGLILLQHVPVIGHGVLIGGHIRGKACQHLIQMGGILGKQDLVQEPGQILVVVLLQNLQHGVLQHIGPAADVGIVHIGHLTVGDLGEMIGQSRGVIGADVQLTVVLAVAPDILVGVVAQTRAQVADGAVGEIGVVVLTGHLLEVAVGVHAVQIDGVVQIVVQQLEVAGGGDLRQVQHGIVVGAQVQIAVVHPHVAAHGVVDAQAEVVAAGAVVTDDLGPGEAAVLMLVAAVHGEALLVDVAVDGLIGDHGDIHGAVILDDVPDTAAVEAVGLHHGGQAVKVVLICHTPPGAQTRGGIGAGHDDAAGGTLAVVVVRGQAHIDLVVKHQQAVNAVGHAPGVVDVVISDGALVGLGVHLDEGGRGAAHTGEIDLALEFKGHAIAGQIVHALEIRGIAGEDVGVILQDVPLPEDHLGLAGVAVHSHDHGGPLGHRGFIEGVRAEHDLHKICRGPAGVHVLVQLALLLHGVQGRLDVVVIDVVGGVVAGADVNVVTGLGHGPGVALAPVLQIAGQDAVHLSGAQRGVGDLVDGVAALGVNTLLQGLVADGVVVIADDGCQCAVDQADRHNQGQQNSGAGFERFVHVILLLKKQFACPCTKNNLSIICAPTGTQ